jgi:hypothetical protein
MSRAPGEVEQPGAVRLTFADDASGSRMVARTPVGKAAPPSEAPATVAPEGVLTVELPTPDDAVTYRQALPRAMPQTIEVYGDPPGALQRVPNRLTSGVFTPSSRPMRRRLRSCSPPARRPCRLGLTCTRWRRTRTTGCLEG